MHSFFTTASVALALAASAHAHMRMSDPPPFRAQENKFATTIDSDMTSPLKSDGSNFPCKGYLSDLGSAAGSSVKSYQPGGAGSVTIIGGANHEGGSCQISLSYDKGQSFTVIKSFIGGCPGSGTTTWDFTVPDDAPQGDAVLSWTWNNKVGNPELYQNCAAVTIGAGAKRVRNVVPRAAVAFSSRPKPFLSNIGNGCKTEAMVVDYPNPGPDVVRSGEATKPSCDGGAGTGTGGGSGGGSGSGSSSAGASSATTAKPSSTAGSGNGNGGGSSPTSAPGGVFITSPGGGSGGASSTQKAPATSTTAPAASSKPAATSTKAPAGTSKAGATSAGSAPTSSPTGGSGSGSGSGSALTGQCTEEGAWNCIGGTSFQRCASGKWSVPMSVAAGTNCAAGKSDTLVLTRNKVRRGGARRFVKPWDSDVQEREVIA